MIIRWKPPRGDVEGYEALMDGEFADQITTQAPIWIAASPVSVAPHVFHVRALNGDGNRGPATTLSFQLGLPDDSTWTGTRIPALEPDALPGVAVTPSTVSWRLDGEACVELGYRVGRGGYTMLDPCATGGAASLAGVAYANGDTIMVQGRVLVDGHVGALVPFGATRIDNQAPASRASRSSRNALARGHVARGCRCSG